MNTLRGLSYVEQHRRREGIESSGRTAVQSRIYHVVVLDRQKTGEGLQKRGQLAKRQRSQDLEQFHHSKIIPSWLIAVSFFLGL